MLASPDLGDFGVLAEMLFEIGPTRGDEALSWVDVDRWQVCTGVELDEFAAVTIVMLSREFGGMQHEAREPNCPSPFTPPATPESRADIAKRLQAAMRGAQPSKKAKRKK